MRLTAIHLCFPNTTLFRVLSNIYAVAIGSFSARVKVHLGHPIELKYQLQSYGIPVELIPTTDTGNVKDANLKHWIKVRKYLENQPTSSVRENVYSSDEDGMDYENIQPSYIPHQQQQFSSQQQHLQIQYPPQNQMQHQHQHQHQQHLRQPTIVECPRSNDVIFRRGKSMSYHPGNVMFQSLIEARLSEHTAASQVHKVSVVLDLIHHIQQERHGRFLTWDSRNNWWQDMMTIPMVVTHNSPGGLFSAQELEIQSKVGYAFRDFRKRMATQERQQTSRSSTFAFERQDGSQKKRRKFGKDNTICGAHFCSDKDNNDLSDDSG